MLCILPHLEVLRLVLRWFALMAHKTVLPAVSCLRIVLLVCMSLYAVMYLPSFHRTLKPQSKVTGNYSTTSLWKSPWILPKDTNMGAVTAALVFDLPADIHILDLALPSNEVNHKALCSYFSALGRDKYGIQPCCRQPIKANGRLQLDGPNAVPSRACV